MPHVGPEWNFYLSLYCAKFEYKFLTFVLALVLMLLVCKMYEDKKIKYWNNWYAVQFIHWLNLLSSFSIKLYKEY